MRKPTERAGVLMHVSAIPARVILSVYATLLLTGCSATYSGERLFWKAQQLSTPMTKEPSKATPQQFTSARSAYETVILRARGTPWAGRAQMAIGSLYALEQQYEKAREAYTVVIQNYGGQKDLSVSARAARAKTYELEQRWDDAIKAYKDVSEYHPWSLVGLEAPLYIARLVEQHHTPDEARGAYERAALFYTKLLPNAPSPALANQVKGYLVLAYQGLGQWKDAVKTLEELLATPTGTNRPLILLTLGAIYQTKLNNPDQAKVSYRTLVEEFPDHPFGKAAKAQLDHMGLSSLSSIATP